MPPFWRYAVLALILSCLSGCVPGRTQVAKDTAIVQDTNANPDSDASAPTDAVLPTDTDPTDALGDAAPGDTEPQQELPDALDSDAATVPDALQDAVGDQQADTEPGDAVLGDDSGDGDSTEPPVEKAKMGVLGDPPAGDYRTIGTFEVRNDRDLIRDLEIATSAIPLASVDGVTDLSRLVVVDDKGAWIQAQFKKLARWGGPLGDPLINDGSPVRWLQIALLVKVPPLTARTFSLRYYNPGTSLSPPEDPFAVTTTAESNGRFSVSTGVATFDLNVWNPALITKITLLKPGANREIYTFSAGDGPRLAVGTSVLETSASYTPGAEGAVFVDFFTSGINNADAFVVEEGPVRTVIRTRGTFKDEASKCANGDQRFKYMAEFTFTRGRADVDLRVNLHNRCSNSLADFDTTPGVHTFSNDTYRVESFVWWFHFNLDDQTTAYYSMDQSIKTLALNATSPATIRVSQTKGSTLTGKWKRRAMLTISAPPTEETSTVLELPFVSFSDSQTQIGATMPWMRFREPVGLSVTEKAIGLHFVEGQLFLGEAKAIWGQAKLIVRDAPANALVVRILRDQTIAELERGLLLRRPIDEFNQTHVLPTLSTDQTGGALKTLYAGLVNTLHDGTVSDLTGQWAGALTFGSQLWPDIQDMSNISFGNTTPFTNMPALNSGDPTRVEFLEFYRTGDPKYVWDFALPQSYLMAFTAWYNTGRSLQDNNGLGISVASTPASEGNWHRTAAPDSFDYARTENGGMMFAYLLRPNSLLLERMAQAGMSVPKFYSEPRLPGDWWKRFTPGRYLSGQGEVGINFYQALTHLANCAEFVPNPVGSGCATTLNTMMTELLADNMSLGLLCSGEDKPSIGPVTHPYDGKGCLITGFFELLDQGLVLLWRYGTSLKSDTFPTIAAAIAGSLKRFHNALPRTTAPPVIDTGATWSSWIGCAIESGSTIGACAMTEADTSTRLEVSQKLLFLGLLLLNRQFGDTVDYCAEIKPLLDSGDVRDNWSNLFQFHTGWDTQTAAHMQSLPFIIGALEACP